MTRQRRAFEAFHENNPHVYDQLVRMARQAKAAGVERWGMKRLFEVLRWERAIESRGEPFLLNNNFTAFYARLVMEREPDLVGFFETRRSQADRER